MRPLAGGPTITVFDLGFTGLIGEHGIPNIPKGYVYAANGFAAMVEG